MYAQVIPLLRTPIGVDVFDYRIPPELHLEPGMLVIVPFRKKPIVALVSTILTNSPFANKASSVLSRYSDIHFPKAFLNLLTWVSLTTFSSKPSVLKTWLRQLPKKPKEVSPQTSLTHHESELYVRWMTNSQEELITTARSLHGRTLIITPWKHRAVILQEHISGAELLGSDMGIRAYFYAWTHFLGRSSSTLVTTRVGAWLAPLTDHVVLDEPENDAHKQDDLSPRFDARRLVLWAQAQGHSSLWSFGLTPPIHVKAQAPKILTNVIPVIHHPKGRSAIFFIENASLQRLRDHKGPIVIIHPVQGEQLHITCMHCDWRALCEHCEFPLSRLAHKTVCRVCKQHGIAPEVCPQCHSDELTKSIPGIEKLKREFAETESELCIEWRTADIVSLEKPFPSHALILLTSGAQLGFGGGEDIRKNERLAIAYRRLADAVRLAQGTLLIQSGEAHAREWKRLLTTEGYTTFRQEELRERKTFAYPPIRRCIKAIVMGTQSDADAWKKNIQLHLKAFDIQGPFPVAHLPSSRSARHVIHLRPPLDIGEDKLIALLTPFAKTAIIDLDPIAFLR